MSNGAIFDPKDKSLIILTRAKDVKVFHESKGLVTIALSNLEDGIEIVHEGKKLWRSV